MVKESLKKPQTPPAKKVVGVTLKHIWIFLTIMFVFNYSLLIIKLVTKKFFALPNWMNCLFLAWAYIITVIQSVRAGGQYMNNPNTLSIFFFINFPHAIYLLSYYFLSIYHLTTHLHKVLKEKNEGVKLKNSASPVKRNAFLVILKTINDNLYINKNRIGEISLYLTLMNVVIAILSFNIRIASLTLMIVRQQFHENKLMEKIILDCCATIDAHIHKTPSIIQELYTRARGMSKNPKVNPNARETAKTK